MPPKVGRAVLAARMRASEISKRLFAGETYRALSADFGISCFSLKRVLTEEGFPIPERQSYVFSPVPIPSLLPGQKVKLKHGTFVFEGTFRCQAGPLWMFRSLTGAWLESFTKYQLREAIAGKEGV
jgi:hypothetical protein